MRAAPFFPYPFNLCQFINVILKDRERKRVRRQRINDLQRKARTDAAHRLKKFEKVFLRLPS